MVGSGDSRSKEVVGMMALHEALRNVCLNSDWTYSVFWTIRPRPRCRGGNGCKVGDDNGSLMLMWEDGFCRTNCLEAIDGDDPVRKTFSKMSIQLYNYGEGLMGKVASDKCHKWVFKEPSECEPNISNYWQSSFDAIPPEWTDQFASGIQTIAVIQAGHGLLQLGSCKIISEDLHFVLRMRHMFESLGFQSGFYLSQLFSSTRNSSTAQSSGGVGVLPKQFPTRVLHPPPHYNWNNHRTLASTACGAGFNPAPHMIGLRGGDDRKDEAHMFLPMNHHSGDQMDDMMADHDPDLKWPNGLSFFTALTGRTDDSKVMFGPGAGGLEDPKSVHNDQGIERPEIDQYHMAMASSALPLIDSVLFEYEGDEDEFSSDGGDACNAKYDDDDGNDDGNSSGMKKSGKEQKSLTSNHLESDTVVQPARFIIFNLPPPSQPRGGTRSSVSLPCSSTSSPRRNKVMIVKASDYKWTSQMGRSRSMTKSFLYRQHSQEIAPLSFQNKDDRITESNSSDHWSSSDPLPDDLNNSSTICGVPLDTEIKPEISSEPHFQRNTGINPDNSVQNNRRPTKYCCVPCRTKIRQDSSDHNFSTTCCITRGDKTQHDKRSTNKCGIQFLRGRKFKSDDDRRSNKCCIPRSTRVKPTDSSDDARFSNNGGVKFPCGKDTENDRSDRSGEDNHRSSRCCIKIKPDKSSSDVINRRSPKCCVSCGGKSKSDSGNNNNRFKYGSLCTFLPGLSKWKKHHHVPSTPRRAGTNRTGIITPVRSDTVSRITSLKKFECGSSSSSVMPSDMAEEKEGPEEGGDSYYELPIEMITDDQVNDTTSPVKAAFFIDQSKDRKGVLKLNDSKSMSTKASISRHVRFLTSPQPSRPCSPTNHEEKNGRLLGWPRRN